MQHFSLSKWTDFVRRVGASGRLTAMEEHLDAGCGRCEKVVKALGEVAGAARAELRNAPADHTLRAVRAFYAVNRPQALESWKALALPVVFDSGLEPALTGVRHSEGAAQLVSFAQNDYAVDLTVERSPGLGSSDAKALVEGQLLRQPDKPLSEVPTFLVGDGGLRATTFTGEMGFFSLEGELADRWELLFFPEDDRVVSVALDPPAAR